MAGLSRGIVSSNAHVHAGQMAYVHAGQLSMRAPARVEKVCSSQGGQPRHVLQHQALGTIPNGMTSEPLMRVTQKNQCRLISAEAPEVFTTIRIGILPSWWVTGFKCVRPGQHATV